MIFVEQFKIFIWEPDFHTDAIITSFVTSEGYKSSSDTFSGNEIPLIQNLNVMKVESFPHMFVKLLVLG